MTTMDVSHIRSVLMSLTKNHVTVPIASNQYEETHCMKIYNNVIQDPFYDMDDFGEECVKASGQIKSSKTKQKAQTSRDEATTSYSEESEPTPCKEPCIRSLLECLYSIHKPCKQKQCSKLELMQMLLDIKEYIASTLLKDLDIAKHKVSKKKLKEDLDFIYTNVDTSNKLEGYNEQVRHLLVVASRYLKCDISVKGDFTFDVKCKHSHTMLTMEYHNEQFSLN
jgi:hypothetical protein